MKQLLLIMTMLMSYGLMAQTNLFQAGNFESGIEGWSTKWNSKTVGTFTTTTDAAAGTTAGLVDVTTPNENITKVVIISPQFTEGIDDHSSYVVSAKLKSNVADNEFKMQVLMLDAAGEPRYNTSPKDDAGLFYKLGTTYQEYKWILGSNKEGYGSAAEFRFQCAKYVAQYFIDDIRLVKIEGIEDGGFEEQNLNFAWDASVNEASGAAGTIVRDTENAHSGTGALKVDVTTVNDTIGHVNIVNQTRYYPQHGQNYEYSFWAKGNAGDSLFAEVNYYKGDNTFITSDVFGVKLTGEYAKYTMPFALADTLFSVKVKMNFGKQVSTIYVDDIAVERVIPASNQIFEKREFSIFPNPVNEELFIKDGQDKHFQIIDLSGKLRKEFRPESLEYLIDVSDLNPGFYIIRNDQNEIRKFVKN